MYKEAATQCAQYGGVISGVQNDFERDLLVREAQRQLAGYKVPMSGMWLGAQRNGSGFYWTDGFTTGTAGFTYGPGQPDNMNIDARV